MVSVANIGKLTINIRTEFKIRSRIVRIKSSVDSHRSEREEIKHKLADFHENVSMLMPKFGQR